MARALITTTRKQVGTTITNAMVATSSISSSDLRGATISLTESSMQTRSIVKIRATCPCVATAAAEAEVIEAIAEEEAIEAIEVVEPCVEVTKTALHSIRQCLRITEQH